MPKTGVVRSYVRPDNTAVINCPFCKRQKEINVVPFTGSKSLLKIKCACKNVFNIQLEYRKRFRKRTNLNGTYVNHTQHNNSGKVHIRDISVSGLGFTSMDIDKLKVDDELTLKFNLDDEQHTEITKEVTIKEIRKDAIGCEFERGGEFAFDGPLGLYVSK